MSSQRETIEIIDKLLELTQDETIKWQSEEAPHNLCNADVRIQLVYTTIYLNKRIRFYELKYKYFVDESQFHWQTKTSFEFVDDNDNILWEFPQTSNAWDLLKAIQYKDSKVSDFYKEMFGK